MSTNKCGSDRRITIFQPSVIIDLLELLMIVKPLGENLLGVRCLQSQSISPLYLTTTKKKKVPLQWRNLWDTTLTRNPN